jgi:hypothetical protein
MNTNRIDYRLAAGLLMAHALILAIGFNVLVVVFEFPDVLRMSAEYRLNLFLSNRAIIIPTYYALAFTGLTQVAIAVLLHRLLADRRDGLLALATTFGILTGLFQVLGFIRWVVLIPYLATGLQDPATGVDPATIVFLEGFANRYLGMTVGEHLGFLAQGIWAALLGVVLLRNKLFDRSLSWATLILGLLFIPLSLEPLGELFSPLEVLSVPVNGGWLILLFLLAISLLRTDVRTGQGIRLGWRAWAIAGVVFALAVLPGMIG